MRQQSSMSATRPLIPELAEKAKNELNEVVDTIERDLELIKDWLKKSPHIKGRSDDQFLLCFLRGCKFSIEKVKLKLDLFYTIRSQLPEIMRNRDPLEKSVLRTIRFGVGIPLSHPNGIAGERIMLIRPGVYKTNEITFQDVMKVGTMMNDIMMRDDDNMIISGQITIIDLANVTASHLMQFNLNFVKRISILNQDASPIRQKDFHFINPPPGFDTVLNMFKGIMSEKNKNKLMLISHGTSIESLHNHFNKDILPTELNGNAGPLSTMITEWEKRLLENRDYLLEDESNCFGVTEALRNGQNTLNYIENGSTNNATNTLSNNTALFGSEGSFRKLEID